MDSSNNSPVSPVRGEELGTQRSLDSVQSKGHETWTADIILRFALAVGKRSSGALLINAKNEFDGRASIEEAARSGRAFAVESLSSVLALDADSTESGELLEGAATKDMEAASLSPVLVESGQLATGTWSCE